MKMRATRLTLIALCAALNLAGCGSDSDPSAVESNGITSSRIVAINGRDIPD